MKRFLLRMNPAQRKLAQIKVELTRRRAAPGRPTREGLGAVFLRAWETVPMRRRPAFFASALSINVVLVSDAEIAKLNAKHMRHNGATDVLSFPIGEIDPERRAFHLGEVVASFETAQREAKARGIPVTEEVTRYCVHGFLHCIGYDDTTPAKRRAMSVVQERALKAFFSRKEAKRKS
jgi:probable rRNA maturation factor